MSKFWNNIFGSMGFGVVPAPTTMDFIPTAPNGNAVTGEGVVFVKGQDPAWLGLNTPQMQYWAYAFCSPLSAVIDRSAEADINGEVQILVDDGSQDFSNSQPARRMKKLLRKPNPIQTWAEFRGQQVVYKKIYGYCPIFAMTPTGFDNSFSSFLWNLNPYYVRPVKNQKFDLYSGEVPIEKWTITISGETYDLPSDKVFIIKDGYLDNCHDDFYLPISKVYGLEFAISNIIATMEADNVLIKKKGPLGFISHDPKPDTVAGYIPMTPKEKEEIQNELSRYGLSWNQWQYVVSKLPVRWNPISFNLRDLMTKETCREGIDMICDRYNYPAELMSGKNATYENRSSAEKFFYQNNVIPSSTRDMTVYNDYFGLDEYDIMMTVDYSKLPVLQEDIVHQGESQNFKATAYLTLYQNSVITLNQYRELMEIDSVEGDDIYYEEAQKKYGATQPPLKVVPPNANQKEKVA